MEEVTTILGLLVILGGVVYLIIWLNRPSERVLAGWQEVAAMTELTVHNPLFGFARLEGMFNGRFVTVTTNAAYLSTRGNMSSSPPTTHYTVQHNRTDKPRARLSRGTVAYNEFLEHGFQGNGAASSGIGTKPDLLWALFADAAMRRRFKEDELSVVVDWKNLRLVAFEHQHESAVIQEMLQLVIELVNRLEAA